MLDLQHISYDPETGAFSRKNGKKFGSRMPRGYLVGKIRGKTYYLHRLAWLYVYGRWPQNEIDHINGIKDDNRICNLREASRSQNLVNKGPQRNNKNGLKGVHWNVRQRKWKVSLSFNKRRINLGSFKNLEDAVEAYKIAAVQYHGEFARAA